jgi:hypothetical protein
MLKEAMEFIQTLTRKEIINCPINGRYSNKETSAIYSDKNGEYLYNQKTVKRSISTITSLIQLVKSEAERRANKTGKYFTVIFKFIINL